MTNDNAIYKSSLSTLNPFSNCLKLLLKLINSKMFAAIKFSFRVDGVDGLKLSTNLTYFHEKTVCVHLGLFGLFF